MPKHIRDKALGIGDFHMKTWLSSQRLRMTEDPQLVDYLLLSLYARKQDSKELQRLDALRVALCLIIKEDLRT